MEARRADGAPGSGDERMLCALGGPARAHAWPVAAAVRPPALLSAQPSAEQDQQEVRRAADAATGSVAAPLPPAPCSRGKPHTPPGPRGPVECEGRWLRGRGLSSSMRLKARRGNSRAEANESRSVVSESFRPHGLFSPWNSPGQNTGVGSLCLLPGIFQTQGSNPGLSRCRQILYQLSHKSGKIRFYLLVVTRLFE